MDLPLNISALQDFTLQNFAKRKCLADEGTSLTFEEFWNVVDIKSKEFQYQRPNAPIAIFAENSISTLINFFAIWKAGGVVVPLNPKLSSSQKEKLLEQIRPERVIPSNENQISGYEKSDFLPDEVDLLIATSGSTGFPKLVALSIANFIWSAHGSSENLAVDPNDTWLISLPLFHVGGMSIIFRTMLAGANAIISPKILDGDFIDQHRITHFSLVATQLSRQINSKFPFGQATKAILLGGSKIPHALIQKSIELNLPIHTSFGCSEMASQVCTTSKEATMDELMTAGKVLAGRQVKIHQDGRIQLNGKTRFLGYWQNQKLLKPFDKDGWFTTNDLGEFDNNGFLKVIGRADRMFISGGENIHPEQIEQALINLEGIMNALVIDMPSETYGSRPVAFLQGQKNYSDPELRKLLSKNLMSFQIPEVFLDWPSQEFSLKPSLDQFRRIAQKRISIRN
ncbi:MAG: o-succinylbenzoate--CoA ligase [Deltaproteobacteria bacterium]